MSGWFRQIDPPQKTLYHRGDPDTSHEAAETTVELRRRHLNAVRGALANGPLAAEQIADRTGLNTLQVMKRISDLRNQKAVTETKIEYRNRSSGKKATVWMGSNHG